MFPMLYLRLYENSSSVDGTIGKLEVKNVLGPQCTINDCNDQILPLIHHISIRVLKIDERN